MLFKNNICSYPLQSTVSAVWYHIDWKQQKILTLLSPPRRSDLARLATEERHSPNPVFFWPAEGGDTPAQRRRHKTVFNPKGCVGVPLKACSSVSAQIPNLKQEIPFLSFPPSSSLLFLPSRQNLSRFFLRPSNSRDGRGNPALRSGKPHVTAASQRTTKGRQPQHTRK